MIKKHKDITDKEYDKFFVPYNHNLKAYMINYIIPEDLLSNLQIAITGAVYAMLRFSNIIIR